MNQKTKRKKTMSKKTQFTRSKNKIGSLSWTSQIYTHGEGKYQNKILHDNIPGYPGYHISKRGIRDNRAGTSTNIRLLY